MGSKLEENMLALYKRIDEILYYEWDPIGVSDDNLARDEYHSYLPRVFAYTIEGESIESIAKYLGIVRIESMGLSSNPDHDLKVARLIIESKKNISG